MHATEALSHDQMLHFVKRYLRAVADGTAEEIASLYAPEATLEDPVGSAPISGREAIAAFYLPLQGLDRSTTLLECRARAGVAAFSFRVAVAAPGSTVVTSPIDIMTFDTDGQIRSMKAVWSEQDISMEAMV